MNSFAFMAVTMPSSRALLLVFLLPALAAAVALASPSISPAEACRSSSLPELCRVLLSPVQSASNMFEYGFYSVNLALKEAQRSAANLRRYIISAGGNVSRSAEDDVPRSSLEICGSLAGLTVGYLASVKNELGRGEAEQNSDRAARVRSLMSAVVTNQQTCSDMLEEDKGVGFPAQLPDELANGTRLYGVSLELVRAALERTAGGSDFFRDFEKVPIKKSLTVSKDGKGQFDNVRDAIKAASHDKSVSKDADGYIVIHIGPGKYKENVLVSGSSNKLMFIGAGINKTVLSSSRSFANGHKTFETGAFSVQNLEKVIVQNITFENTAGPKKMQAAAARVSSDLTVFYRCSFLGYQDTLYAHTGRQFYRECDIYGTIDFIFGDSAAVLQNCIIYVRLPENGQYNVVTAQGRTMKSSDTGTSIHNCKIEAAPELKEAVKKGKAPSTYLGRPWKAYSRTVVMQSHISGIVDKAGWAKWTGSQAVSTLYYGEYDNDGEGSDTKGRVKWPGYKRMDSDDASKFTVKNFVKAVDWLRAMSIPNDAGLL